MMNKELYMASRVETFMPKVYTWMFAGLLTTATVATALYWHINLLAYVLSFKYAMIGLLIGQVTLISYLGSQIFNMSYTRATALFLTYSALVGVTCAPLFIVYHVESMVQVFFVTAGMFGAMALYGYGTQTDLSRMSNILFMALVGIIIASVVNMFMVSSRFDFYISIAGVLIFTAFTAYDVQRIKQLGEQLQYTDMWDEEMHTRSKKVALLGAVTLYLDFLNLFLSLLRLSGNKRK